MLFLPQEEVGLPGISRKDNVSLFKLSLDLLALPKALYVMVSWYSDFLTDLGVLGICIRFGSKSSQPTLGSPLNLGDPWRPLATLGDHWRHA